MSRIKSLYPFAQKWQERGNIQIFSDPHWNDADRAYMGYDIDEKIQVQNLIQNLRSNDTLVCLGDIGNPTWMDYIKAKRHHIHTVLILGNHDKKSVLKERFDEIYEGPLMIAPKIMLSHEPVESNYWVNIHGHDHGGYPVNYQPYIINDNEYVIRGVNLAGNVCNFELFCLNDRVNKEGLLKDVKDIHRQQIERKKNE